MKHTPTTRLVFLDNLRVVLTSLVVAHHAAQPYGPTGGAWPLFNPDRAVILGPFFAVNAAFFMGLFFFIAGYLTPAAYDRKGPQRFLWIRFQRLGIPLVVFSLVVFPPVLYHLSGPPQSFFTFIAHVYIHPLKIEVAHLWFLLHLLVYAVGHALWQQRPRRFRVLASYPVPGHGAIVLYLLGLTGLTVLVRIYYPIDRWVRLFGFLPTEVAHLPQYVSLFIAGTVAYRFNWLRQIDKTKGFIWLIIGLTAALLRYAYSIGQNNHLLPDIIAGGGWDWRSVVWSGWEATICVGLCVGLLVLFRETLNHQNQVTALLSHNAYGVYLIHLVMVVYLQVAIANTPLGPLLKFGLVTLIGVPLCFTISVFLRKVPIFRYVLP
ncbi:MAG: acyltransferase family protein [Leptolyngbyaceae cyanobacterium]